MGDVPQLSVIDLFDLFHLKLTKNSIQFFLTGGQHFSSVSLLIKPVQGKGITFLQAQFFQHNFPTFQMNCNKKILLITLFLLLAYFFLCILRDGQA